MISTTSTVITITRGTSGQSASSGATVRNSSNTVGKMPSQVTVATFHFGGGALVVVPAGANQ